MIMSKDRLMMTSFVVFAVFPHPPTQKEAEREEQLWDYEEYIHSGIIRNKTGLVADVKALTGPEVMMMKKIFLNLMLDSRGMFLI